MKKTSKVIVHLHEKAMRNNHDFYVDPVTGHQVMTEQYLWNREWCCKSGCRHCPY